MSRWIRSCMGVGVLCPTVRAKRPAAAVMVLVAAAMAVVAVVLAEVAMAAVMAVVVVAPVEAVVAVSATMRCIRRCMGVGDGAGVGDNAPC